MKKNTIFVGALGVIAGAIIGLLVGYWLMSESSVSYNQGWQAARLKLLAGRTRNGQPAAINSLVGTITAINPDKSLALTVKPLTVLDTAAMTKRMVMTTDQTVISGRQHNTLAQIYSQAWAGKIDSLKAQLAKLRLSIPADGVKLKQLTAQLRAAVQSAQAEHDAQLQTLKDKLSKLGDGDPQRAALTKQIADLTADYLTVPLSLGDLQVGDEITVSAGQDLASQLKFTAEKIEKTLPATK